MKRSVAVLLLLAAPLSAGSDLPVFRLTLKGHQFAPQKVTVPLGRKFKLVVSNEDAEPAEFESFVLHREQVVVGKSEAVVYLGPLKAGRYEFIDDFHSQTRGVIEAAAAEKK
ncbi:MAG: cupredoxin domain-containing protein [Elusimicrobia bacterium]|nr:cupredoxin domain-containing protein [Elusimicrobiota bacterium]